MAGVKISALPAVLAAMSTDFFPVVQAGVTSQETLAQVQTLFGMPGGITSPSHGGTGIANLDANTVTWGGPIVFANGFTTTGAFNPTLAFAAAGTYTFPSASQTMLGLLGGTLTGKLTLTPAQQTNPNDAATISMIQAKNLKDPCDAATTGALTVTYANGAAGVGATLTNNGAQAAFATDGYSYVVGDRALIKNQASSLQNGIYTVTNIGSGATNWVLTRSTDMDEPGDFENATSLILNGTTLANTTWTETLVVTTVGTDPVTFVQTGFGGSVTSVGSGTGLTGGPITTTGTLSFASIAAHSLWANVTAGAAVPTVVGTNTFLQSVAIQTFTTAGAATYTPTTGMRFVVIEGVGSGGGSGGCAGGAGSSGASGGAGSGGYFRAVMTAANIGASAAIVIGTGGAGGAAGNNAGSNGSATTFTPAGTGGVLTGNGGTASLGSAGTATSNLYSGGVGSSATGGNINIKGGDGSIGLVVLGTAGVVFPGLGGGNLLGSPSFNVNSASGNANNNYGTGACGVGDGAANRAGNAGADGAIFITEYIAI